MACRGSIENYRPKLLASDSFQRRSKSRRLVDARQSRHPILEFAELADKLVHSGLFCQLRPLIHLLLYDFGGLHFHHPQTFHSRNLGRLPRELHLERVGERVRRVGGDEKDVAPAAFEAVLRALDGEGRRAGCLPHPALPSDEDEVELFVADDVPERSGAPRFARCSAADPHEVREGLSPPQAAFSARGGEERGKPAAAGWCQDAERRRRDDEEPVESQAAPAGAVIIPRPQLH
mmetsp:Transcript_19942/g.48826  ORF Transcript_19942/g.48826 Transcript_19942/m.48826 type:complete len:234 (+) Transcript_19942:696-1397(+)